MANIDPFPQGRRSTVVPVKVIDDYRIPKVVGKEYLLEIDRVFNNKNSTVRIYSNTPGASFRVKGFINSNFNDSGRNDWDAPLDNALDNTVFQYGKTTQLGLMAVGSLAPALAASKLGRRLMSTSFKSSYNSLIQYAGSQKPMFEVDMAIINYAHSQNALDDATTLKSMVLPHHAGKLLLTNPLKYAPTIVGNEFSGSGGDNLSVNGSFSDSTAQAGPGTITLAYGNYFFATGLVCRNCNFSLSAEVVEDGTPLYATIHATFEPKTIIDIFQYRRYFRGLRTGKQTLEGQPQEGSIAEDIDNLVTPILNAANTGVTTGLDTLDALGKAFTSIVVDPFTNNFGGFLKGGPTSGTPPQNGD